MSDPLSTVSSALIGEIFVERGHITPAQLEEALATQAETGELLGEILVSRYNVPRVELAGVLAEQWATMERGGGVTPNEPMAEAAAHYASESPTDSSTPAEVDFERRPIGEIFVEQGVVTPSELEAALATQAESGQRLGEVLVAQGVITRLELASALADQWSTLQKIRPPEPRPSEPWQELAVRATSSAEAPLSPTPHRYESSAEVEGLRDAVKALEERLRLVSATSSAANESVPDEALRELEATFESRLDELAHRFDETVTTDIAHVRTALEELQARVAGTSAERVDELEKRLETAVDGLLARIESATNNGTDEAVEGLRATLAGLEHRNAEMPTRDELDALRVAFGAVSDDVRKLSEVPAGITHHELEQHLARVAGDLGARIDGLAASTNDNAALDHVRAEVWALAEQVAELPKAFEPSDLADRIGGLGSRLDEVANAIAQASADTETLRTAIDAERESRGAIAGKLDEAVERLGSIDELRARVDALGDAPGRIDATVDEMDSRLTLLTGTVAALPTSERVSAVEEAIATLPDADRVAALEQSIAAVAELRAHLDTIAAAPAGASSGDVATLAARLDELGGKLDAFATTDRVSELERVVDTLRSVESGQIDSLRTSVRELSDSLRELSSRPTGVSADELEQSLALLRARLDELAAIQPSTLRGPDDVTRDQVDELVAGERAARDELTGRVNDLGNAVGGLAELPGRVDALAATAGSDEIARQGLAEVRAQLEGIGTRVGEAAGHELAELKARIDLLATEGSDEEARRQLVALQDRLDEVVARLDASGQATDELHQLRDRVESLATDYGSRLHALEATQSRVEELDRRIEGLATPPADTADTLAALEVTRSRVDELDRRVEGLATAPADTADTLAALEVTQSRVDELDRRIEGLATPPADIADRLAALERLPGRVDELASSGTTDDVARHGLAELRTRLDQLAELAAELGTDESARQELAELNARVEQLGAGGASHEAIVAIEDAIAAQRDELEGRFAAVWGKVTELEEYRGRLDRLDAAQVDAIGRPEVDDVKARLAALAARLETVAPSDWVAGIERTATETAGALQLRIDALEELATGSTTSSELAEARSALAGLETRLQQLALELEQTQGNVVAIDGNLAATLDAAVRDMVSAATVAEITDQVHDRLSAIEAASAPTRAALDELGMRLGATEQRAWALPDELDDRFGRIYQELTARIEALSNGQSAAIASVHARLDAVEGVDDGRLAALESASSIAAVRLEGLETRLADADGTVVERVDALESRFEEESQRAEERGKATERAIRKGLAGLAERLTANEQAYVESGQALRRAIERLGAAVIEADTRIAGLPLDAPDNGFVAFVPTTDGYRLRPLEGAVPTVGSVLDLGDEGGQLRVSRIATSPLPLDRRACAYLERV